MLHGRFLLNMMSFPEMIRNVAVVGHLHHGKTALMDMLVFETHKLVWDADKPVRWSFRIPMRIYDCRTNLVFIDSIYGHPYFVA